MAMGVGMTTDGVLLGAAGGHGVGFNREASRSEVRNRTRAGDSSLLWARVSFGIAIRSAAKSARIVTRVRMFGREPGRGALERPCG